MGLRHTGGEKPIYKKSLGLWIAAPGTRVVVVGCILEEEKGYPTVFPASSKACRQ
jgi:hypothetical protein